MKICFTGDNHVSHSGTSVKQVTDMVAQMKEEKPDVVILLGDMDEVVINGGERTKPLFDFDRVLYVLGNHDLYSHERHTPPNSFNIALEKYRKIAPYAIHLQSKWEDDKKTFAMGDYLFVGSMGFPDFGGRLIMPAGFYNHRFPTCDGEYINLNLGWMLYSVPLMNAFEDKLVLVDKSKCTNIVIATHYPILVEQYTPNPSDDMSPYFFCQRMGDLVRDCAARNPGKRFYCVAAHGHSYCHGEWFDFSLNASAYGLKTDYHRQDFVTLEL